MTGTARPQRPPAGLTPRMIAGQLCIANARALVWSWSKTRTGSMICCVEPITGHTLA